MHGPLVIHHSPLLRRLLQRHRPLLRLLARHGLGGHEDDARAARGARGEILYHLQRVGDVLARRRLARHRQQHVRGRLAVKVEPKILLRRAADEGLVLRRAFAAPD